MQNKENPFTVEEKEIFDLLIKANEKFVNYLNSQPNHIQTAINWNKNINGLQDILVNMVVKRDYPNHFFKTLIE